MSGSSTLLTIRNTAGDLPLAQDALDRFGRKHGVPKTAIDQLHVVLDELLSNVIKYAWPGGGEHELALAFSVGSGPSLRIEITHDGVAFNPLAAPAPVARAAGKRPKPGGVGIHMVRQLVDGMEYARVGGVNRLVVTKNCS